MAVQQLMLNNSPRQTAIVSMNINGKVIDLEIKLNYNKIAGYWVANIKDLDKNETVIASMPLFCGQNLLGQYGYLEIGVSALINKGYYNPDDVNMNNFGKDFIWCWDDNF